MSNIELGDSYEKKNEDGTVTIVYRMKNFWDKMIQSSKNSKLYLEIYPILLVWNSALTEYEDNKPSNYPINDLPLSCLELPIIRSKSKICNFDASEDGVYYNQIKVSGGENASYTLYIRGR
jgi:hypothetical protein